MKLRILRADPAGNVTVFVLDAVEKAERSRIAQRIMAMPEWGAEQVGFACSPCSDVDGRMEMAGGEFCGNATRAYGMVLARQRGKDGTFRLEVSGCHHPLAVCVTGETACTEMPLPLWERQESVKDIPCTLVHLGGIAHLIVENVIPSTDFFADAEPILQSLPDLDAYGVIFLDGSRLTPLIKVPSQHTLVWEGSCGSGSLAAAAARSCHMADGSVSFTFRQPAGTVTAEIERCAGRMTAARISGSVILGEPQEIEV